MTDLDKAQAILNRGGWIGGELGSRIVGELRRLKSATADVLFDLQDRYDGAPDSTELWMGEHITRLSKFVESRVVA